MSHQKTATTLVELTGNLIAKTEKDRYSLRRLRENIARSVIKDPALSVRDTPFHSERIDAISGIPLEERPLFRDMADLAAEISRQKPKKDEPEYRVFRRTTPTISAQLPGSVPSWGAGGQVSFTEGPFLAANGLTYWFDFYLIIRTIAVYIGNEPLPSMLVPMRISIIGKHQTAYRIRGDSIWIRSDLFASGAPSGHYTGLKISDGTMTLSEPGSRTDDRLDISAGTSINLKLTLVQQDGPTPATSSYGEDARLSSIQLPNHAELDVTLNDLSVTAMEQAKWDLYKDARSFELHASHQPTYSDELKRILIPCRTQPDKIEIPPAAVQSPLINMSGQGEAQQAAWTLPTALIDINTPPAAAGTGGLAVLFDTDMQLGWKGLDGSPVQPHNTWYQLEPGIINLTAAKACNILGKQQFELWENETTGFASEARLQFTDEFLLLYYCLSNGYEAIFAQADSEILTDRPVRVDGQPFEIKGKDTFFLYFVSDPYQGILLFDPNILVDKALDDAATIKDPAVFESCAIALNNSLLTVTKPVSYYLAGQLQDERTLKNGKLFLLNGLYYFLPTLPDPYAANLGPFLRSQQREVGNIRGGSANYKRIIAYLLCTVSWPAEEDSGDLNAEVAYQFLPLQAGNIGRIGFQCGQFAAATVTQTGANPDLLASDEASTFSALAGHADDHYNPDQFEGPWDKYLTVFGQDCYSLLDVSTNADLMGITYSPINRDVLLRMTHQVLADDGPSNTTPVPYEIEGMDLKASGQFVKAFSVPHISWEPVVNLSDIQDLPADPPQGFLGLPDDGGPTRLFNTSVKTVTLAPIPVTNFLIEEFKNGNETATFSLFTLPFGMHAMARINPDNHFPEGGDGSEFELNQPEFDPDLRGGIQLKTTGAYNEQQDNLNFQGNTLQRTNLISSSPNKTSVLGEIVTRSFNVEFSADLPSDFFTNRGVPLERIDFSGYGASMFSNWLNNDAKNSETSQAKFDVLLGRTAHEVIQVRKVIQPWGIYMVRTITLFRVGSGYVYRVDSGWKPQSDGEYDFNFTVESSDNSATDSYFMTNHKNFFAEFNPLEFDKVKNLRPYAFYPGVVKRISNVRNIRDTTDFPTFYYDPDRLKVAGEVFMDQNGKVKPVGSNEIGTPWNVTLTPVKFTANVHIDDVKEGAVNGSVLSKEMIGYVQISPVGTPIPRDALAQLLRERPEIGGQVDCVVDIGKTGQLMRISRVEINNSLDSNSREIFAGVAKGTPILPKDGSWSLARHDAQTNEVTSIGNDFGVPLIRGGEWLRADDGSWSANQAGELLRLADPADLLDSNPGDVFNYAFLQNTGSQKTLFSLPSFEEGVKVLKTNSQHFADAYHLLNSKGTFPNLNDIDTLLDLDSKNIGVSIIKEGFQLIDKGTEKPQALKKDILSGRWYWVGSAGGEEVVKIYLRYSAPDPKDPNTILDSALDFDLDSAAKNWVSTMNDTSIVIDLGDMKELFTVRGSFDSQKGAPVSINQPILEVGPDLKPIYDVLVILVELSQALDTGSYGDLLKKGLEVAMSNTPEVWDYKFSAEKEIPILRFPPPALDSATSPLRLEASLRLGAYFNMDSPVSSTDVNQLIPSAGAYVEFYAQLSVMCVSLAAATVYAVGQTEVRIYGDLKSGPGITMRHGFGIELAVGLPVVGTVSLLYKVGIDMDLNGKEIEVGAFLLFRGRAEILGGIVTVTIYIEAQGSIKRISPPPNAPASEGKTLMEAQVTFGLDINIFLIIDISFEESWTETRQIG